MKIGIIGIGTTTLDFAVRASQAGYEVLLNNPRGNCHCSEIIKKLGKKAKLACLEKTAEAEIIILFVPFENLISTLENLPDMTGKIILHTNNYLFSPIYSLEDSRKTASGIIASMLPNSHIVKAFSISNKEMNPNKQLSESTQMLFTTDNTEVQKTVKTFFEKLKFSSTALNEYYQFNPLQDLNSVRF